MVVAFHSAAEASAGILAWNRPPGGPPAATAGDLHGGARPIPPGGEDREQWRRGDRQAPFAENEKSSYLRSLSRRPGGARPSSERTLADDLRI